METSIIEQGSDAWHDRRRGKATASRTSDIMAKTKTGYGAARKNYLMELLCERLTGVTAEGFVSAPMLRGIALEAVARSAYEVATGNSVKEVGFVDHPTLKMAGCSPDGLVGGGLLEIKCPNVATHIDFLRTGNVELKYFWQMQMQMSCCEAEWCDFVSFDDRLPERLQYKCVRVERDVEKQGNMLTEISRFLIELDELIVELSEIQP